MAQSAMQVILENEHFRDSAVYQPRTWFNAHQRRSDFEGKPGSLMVHFQHLEGDKWLHMASWLDVLRHGRKTYEIPLKDTTYEVELEEYWNRIRLARKLLKNTDGKGIPDKDSVRAAIERLQFALNFEADQEAIFNDALDVMKEEMPLTGDDASE